MLKDTGIILASHGKFAVEVLNSLEMIMGKQNNIVTLSLEVGENLNGFYNSLEDAYNTLEKSNGTIIICDILGGTPSNATKMLIANYGTENIAAYAGLNLAILLEIVPNRSQRFNEIKNIINVSSDFIWNEIETQDLYNDSDEDEAEGFDL